MASALTWVWTYQVPVPCLPRQMRERHGKFTIWTLFSEQSDFFEWYPMQIRMIDVSFGRESTCT